MKEFTLLILGAIAGSIWTMNILHWTGALW